MPAKYSRSLYSPSSSCSPQVGPNGSVAPAPGSGLPPARSEAEEIQEKADEHKSDADWEVKWEAGEAGNPLNWPMAKKCWLTFASGIRESARAVTVGAPVHSELTDALPPLRSSLLAVVLNASFASSAPSATVAATMADLGISDITVGTLVVSSASPPRPPRLDFILTDKLISLPFDSLCPWILLRPARLGPSL